MSYPFTLPGRILTVRPELGDDLRPVDVFVRNAQNSEGLWEYDLEDVKRIRLYFYRIEWLAHPTPSLPPSSGDGWREGDMSNVAPDIYVDPILPTTNTVFTGSNGAAWPAPWSGLGQNGEGGGSATIQSNAGRLQTGNTYGSYDSRSATSRRHAEQARNFDISFDVLIPAEMRYARFVFRADTPDLVGANTVEVPLFPQDVPASSLCVFQNVGWSYSLRASAAGTWAVSTSYRLRVQADGPDIRVKRWTPGGAEPGSWALNATTANTSIGYLGFLNGPTNAAGLRTVSFDNIQVN